MKTLVSSGVEPSETPVQHLHIQITEFKIALQNRNDLKLPARRRNYIVGVVARITIKKIESGNGPRGSWMLRLLLNRQCAALLIQLYYAELTRITYKTCENGGASTVDSTIDKRLQTVSEKDVIPENQHAGRAVEKISTYSISIGKTPRMLLSGIGKMNAPLRTVSQQPAKGRAIIGSSDNKNISHSSHN